MQYERRDACKGVSLRNVLGLRYSLSPERAGLHSSGVGGGPTDANTARARSPWSGPPVGGTESPRCGGCHTAADPQAAARLLHFVPALGAGQIMPLRDLRVLNDDGWFELSAPLLPDPQLHQLPGVAITGLIGVSGRHQNRFGMQCDLLQQSF